MFLTIFLYEVKYWLKQPSVYIYWFIFFLISSAAMAGTLGAFDSPSVPEVIVIENSPFEINSKINTFTLLLLFLLPSIIGNSIYRDYKSNMYAVLYSYPFSKSNYLFAKFTSSFCIVLLIVSAIGIGLYAGTQSPGVQEASLGAFALTAYLQTYVIYIIPNILFYGAIVFAVVVFSRNIYAGFITVVILLFIPELIKNIISDGFLLSLLDPFGKTASGYYTRDWTLAEQNYLFVPVRGVIIYNRALWLVLSALIFGIVYKRFTLSQNSVSNYSKGSKSERLTKDNFGSITKVNLPTVRYDHSFYQHVKIILRLSAMDFGHIIRSWQFISILFGGFIVALFILLKMNPQFENEILPVTWLMLSYPVLFFSLVISFITFLYAGILVQRERTADINQLVDSTPVPDWLLLISKFFTIIQIQLVLLSLIMAAGILVQIYKGYYNFELGHYFFELFILNLTGFVIWAFAAVFVQTLFKNIYLGMFFLILAYLGIEQLSILGIEQNIFKFNQGPGFLFEYTDMNGYGNSLLPFFIYKLYWSLAGIILFIGAFLFLPRGFQYSFRERLDVAGNRLKSGAGIAIVILFGAFITIGFGIYKEENKLQYGADFEKDEKTLIAGFKEKYGKYENTIQPRIVSVNINMDIYPGSQSFKATGFYTLINKSGKIIDTLLVRTGFDELTTYVLDKKVTTISSNPAREFDVLLLKESLAPGDSLRLSFDVKNKPNTIFQINSNVLQNGTFIMNDVFPRLGYNAADTKAHPSDSTALENHYQAEDSDLIDFETIVSTSEDQTAIAPGYLQKEWLDGGRRYFHYKMDHKMKFSFGFNSARYKVVKDSWNEVELEIYYHKDHPYNLDRMMKGLKASLEYNSNNFSPYQHKQVRIIEFPVTRGSFATVFGNSILFSEIRFIADVNDTKEDGIDLPFYVAAHELAHQWWGNQVVPANTLGAQMITESMAEYVSVKVLEHEYGMPKKRNYLKKYMEEYLSNRVKDAGEEKPLMYSEGQKYINYLKGALVLNSLSSYIGEKNLNSALRAYIEEVRFRGPPYTTTPELLWFIGKAVPDSMQYLLEDMFETVTLYDNRIEGAIVTELPDGKYKIDISFVVSKYRSGTDRKKESTTPLPLADYVEIGIIGEGGAELQIERYKITQTKNDLSFIIDRKPVEVLLDPNYLLIDSGLDDNRKRF